jgi:hypothetical protein
MRYPRIAFAIASFAALLALPAAAQTMYKLIGKDGKVTYSESPPKEFDGQVVPIHINRKANTMTMPRPQAGPSPQVTETARTLARPAPGAEVSKAQAAHDKLEAAKKALQDATDNPREEDVRRVGNKGGFTRPVPTEEYQQRLDALKENVRKAEEELRVAEGR